MPLLLLMYFSAFTIPLGYFAFTRGKGRANRAMLAGIGIHIFWYFVVYGFVYYSWMAGYSEYYWGWALLFPVNIVSGFYYIGALIYKYRKSSQERPGT